MRFRILAMPTATAEKFRTSGSDDFGNPVRAMTADADNGYFCRHCLAQPGKGHAVLLGSYDVGRPKGHYWQPSPIFVHDSSCPLYEGDGAISSIRARGLVGECSSL